LPGSCEGAGELIRGRKADLVPAACKLGCQSHPRHDASAMRHA
jgi:hypothetical protein